MKEIVFSAEPMETEADSAVLVETALNEDTTFVNPNHVDQANGGGGDASDDLRFVVSLCSFTVQEILADPQSKV